MNKMTSKQKHFPIVGGRWDGLFLSLPSNAKDITPVIVANIRMLEDQAGNFGTQKLTSSGSTYFCITDDGELHPFSEGKE